MFSCNPSHPSSSPPSQGAEDPDPPVRHRRDRGADHGHRAAQAPLPTVLRGVPRPRGGQDPHARAAHHQHLRVCQGFVCVCKYVYELEICARICVLIGILFGMGRMCMCSIDVSIDTYSFNLTHTWHGVSSSIIAEYTRSNVVPLSTPRGFQSALDLHDRKMTK